MAEPHEDEAIPAPSLDQKSVTVHKKMQDHKKRHPALRKAPQAPKRFKSSYICFYMAKQPEIKKELGEKATVAEISKRSAEMWRNLPADERAHWDEVAAKDKQRFMAEKSSYTGPWQIPWKRTKKDPSAPKRPMSAFLHFSQTRRKTMKAENPGLSNTEVSCLLGKEWREASEEKRAPYVEVEKTEREKYKVNMEKWRQENAEKMEEQAKNQAAQAVPYYGTGGNEQDAVNPSEQYNFIPPTGTNGYDPNMMVPQQQYMGQQQQQQPQQYMGQQQQLPQQYVGQQQPGQMYNYQAQVPYPGYATGPYGYAAQNTFQSFVNGRGVMVLSPNGMPHYQPAYATGQTDQGQSYDEGVQEQEQQVAFD